jgi:hypothetical protein
MAMSATPHFKKPICFVIMPFQEPFDGYYKEIIKPVSEKAGFIVERSENIMQSGSQMHHFANCVEAAQVIIVDLTGNDPNAHYGLGLLHSWNKPVIALAQSKDDVPIDIQMLQWIAYSSGAPAWEKTLSDSIFNALIAVQRGNRKAYLLPSVDLAMSICCGDLFSRFNQISGNQKKLLEFIKKIEKPMDQQAMEKHFPEFNGNELFYRLEKLRLQGFLVSHETRQHTSGEDLYTFELSMAARQACG